MREYPQAIQNGGALIRESRAVSRVAEPFVAFLTSPFPHSFAADEQHVQIMQKIIKKLTARAGYNPEDIPNPSEPELAPSRPIQSLTLAAQPPSPSPSARPLLCRARGTGLPGRI